MGVQGGGQPHHTTAGGGHGTPQYSGFEGVPTIDDDDDDDDDAADVAAAAVAGTTTPHHTTGGGGGAEGNSARQHHTTPHHTTGAGGGEQCKTAGLRGCQPLGGGGGGGDDRTCIIYTYLFTYIYIYIYISYCFKATYILPLIQALEGTFLLTCMTNPDREPVYCPKTLNPGLSKPYALKGPLKRTPSNPSKTFLKGTRLQSP